MKQLKELIIKTAYTAQEGHIPSALSILDILWVLYDRIMTYDIHNPTKEERDIFILSKGHASLGLYAVLGQKGFFDIQELENFCTFESNFGGHPDRKKVPGVEASTGSLGHGMPMAVGHALSAKIKKIPKHVFVLIGDGEANEGTIWESALLASHHQLSNLYCIVDYNHSTDRALGMGDLVQKFDSFGWDAISIDGHDQEAIFEALSRKSSKKPMAIIANTIKGNGCVVMENNPAWHHKCPKSKEELDQLLDSLS